MPPADTVPVSDQLQYSLSVHASAAVELCLRHPGSVRPRRMAYASSKTAHGLLKKEWLTSEDRRILMRLIMRMSGSQSTVLLKGGEGSEILREVLRTGRAVWEEDFEPLAWNPEPLGAVVTWKLLGPDEQQPILELRDESVLLLHVTPLLALHPLDRSVQPVETGFPPAFSARWARSGSLNAEQASFFYDQLVDAFPDTAPPPPPTIQRRVERAGEPTPRLNIRQREFLPRRFGRPLKAYVGELWFDYEGQSLRFLSSTDHASVVEKDQVREIKRDRSFEKEEARVLKEVGFRRASQFIEGYELEDARDDFIGPEDGVLWYKFLAEHQPALQARGWTFQFEGRQDIAVAGETDEYHDIIPGEDNQGWFEFEAGVVVEGERVNLLPLIHDLLQRYAGMTSEEMRAELAPQVFFVPTTSGTMHVFPGERFLSIMERIFELYDRDPFLPTGRLRVNGMRAAELHEEFSAGGGEAAPVPGISDGMQRLARLLKEGVQIQPIDEPPGLKATLRDYQKIGVGWLQFLTEHHANGVLADDMGLGKTLQTITHLALEKHQGRLTKPALLVVPTSLLPNWQAEVKKFAPGLSVLPIYGPDRRRYFRVASAADIVITTYGLARRDEERHREINYSWIILDEAQFIKNAQSRVAKALATFHSDRRLCLTGTPLENHLGELWSLFHFLMPGFLGEAESFRKRFRIPIEQEGSDALRDVLARRVRPFLLRRRKVEVVRELPPKTEIDHPVQMMENQRDIYESIRVAMHEKVQEEIAERGLARSQIVILDALMRLRQICCDPRLANPDEKQLSARDSGKLSELIDLVPEMIGNGNRILIFSQFTTMLSLMEDEFRGMGIPWVKLTGATRDRAGCVTAFQTGKVPLFLISLRAGGVGLNLTEADTVIHYDPWWNPAVESQATDRAYRIGQKKPVFVYKMITEGTVEEKIVEMQQKKAALADGILNGTSSTKLRFEASDIQALFGLGKKGSG